MWSSQISSIVGLTPEQHGIGVCCRVLPRGQSVSRSQLEIHHGIMRRCTSQKGAHVALTKAEPPGERQMEFWFANWQAANERLMATWFSSA